MLFNSFGFMFAFLPVALAGFFSLSRVRPSWGAVWLVLCSVVFYGWWSPRYVLLLAGSILLNFAAGRLLSMLRGRPAQRLALALAITANLAVLCYYKYANFFLDTIDTATGLGWSLGHVVLPLGISFFSFTQIAYLVDVKQGRASDSSLVHYALFVTYFPHLIAGPILHHAEMMPQFANPDVYRWNGDRFMVGLSTFTLGLAKKVILADQAATYANPMFDAAARGHMLPLAESWAGALSYTFQLYFDFSGYCDMAIGASWMFGIGLPLNFNSPYKARSIVDFWRRWHMTLSRFLRDYLYIPLGGNRLGPTRRTLNLFATMLIGGLWHGAGWTFVVWGALHGLYLIINHAYAAWRPGSRAGLSGWALTFLAVVVGWVFFRASSLSDALAILQGMAGVHGAGDLVALGPAWLWCALSAAICFAMPNTEEIMRRHLPPICTPRPSGQAHAAVAFAPSPAWAVVVSAALASSLVCLSQPTSFLYFNF